MKPTPPISERKTAVAVLSFNKSRFTVGCLESVLASGWPPADTLCFDNGSLPEHRQRVIRRFPAVRHHGIGANRGFSGGFNRALTHLFQQGFEVVFFLTNDTLMTPSTIPAALKAAEKSGASIVAPAVYYQFAPRKLHSIGGYLNTETVTLHHYQETGLSVRLNPDRDYVPGTALMITREAFDSLGGADESYHTYWEDVDLSFRAHRAGIPMARAYSSILLHGVGATCHKKPLYTSYYYPRNRLRFCEKFFAGKELTRARELIREEIQQKLESARRGETRGHPKRIRYLQQILAEHFS